MTGEARVWPSPQAPPARGACGCTSRLSDIPWDTPDGDEEEDDDEDWDEDEGDEDEEAPEWIVGHCGSGLDSFQRTT